MDFCPHDTALLLPSPSSASFHWYPSTYLSDSMSNMPVIRPVTTQSYTVVGTSAQGCKDTFSFTATVHPAAIMFMPDSVTIYPGESYHIEPVTNCNTFAWFPPAGLNADNVADPVATPDLSTKYIVNASTEWGCKVTDSIDIIVDPNPAIQVPNAFVPGSGPNGEFKIINRGIASLNYFRIFNRWGNQVFETKDINDGWDGAYKGQQQPLGVYVYEVQAVGTSGKIFTKRGNLTLIR
jgi:gliding motility-associated-like protein